ncbi:MAG: SdpI family protein [Olleya sp.]
MDFLVNKLLFPSFLSGLIFVITGFIMLKFPPKKINILYGYRSKRSMKNQKNWNFAQIYSAKQLIICGLFLTIISCIGLVIPMGNKLKLFLSFSLIISSVIYLLIKTENALKQAP